MSSGWNSFKNRFGGKKQQDDALDSRREHVEAREPAATPSRAALDETVAARPTGALDAVGQKNELIRVRFANLIDRLEEIRSLKEDFALLSEPVNDLIRNYPQLQSRLLETEAVLRRETETTLALRRGVGGLGSGPAPAMDELSAALSPLRKAG